MAVKEIDTIFLLFNCQFNVTCRLFNIKKIYKFYCFIDIIILKLVFIVIKQDMSTLPSL